MLPTPSWPNTAAKAILATLIFISPLFIYVERSTGRHAHTSRRRNGHRRVVWHPPGSLPREGAGRGVQELRRGQGLRARVVVVDYRDTIRPPLGRRVPQLLPDRLPRHGQPERSGQRVEGEGSM